MTYKNNTFYEKAIKKYGFTPQGVHWKNQQTQYARFDAISSFLDQEKTPFSLVDAGCGFGEYYHYLSHRKYPVSQYIGIDCEKKMIQYSQKRFPDISFYQKNILFDPLPFADFYICSGALNILQIDEVEIFIRRIYQHSKKGAIFNSLQKETFNQIEKEDIVGIIKSFHKHFVIKEDYLDNDFTIALFV